MGESKMFWDRDFSQKAFIIIHIHNVVPPSIYERNVLYTALRLHKYPQDIPQDITQPLPYRDFPLIRRVIQGKHRTRASHPPRRRGEYLRHTE